MNIDFQDSKSMKFFELNLQALPKWKTTFLLEIWKENNLSDLEFLREQVHQLYQLANSKYNSQDYRLSYTETGLFFGVSKQRIHQIIEKQKKILSGKSPKSTGRQSLLTDIQKNSIIQWVREQHENKEPPTVEDLTDYVRDVLKIDCSTTWSTKWIQSKDSGLFVIDAKPLEKERAEVTVDQLKEYEKKLKEEIKSVDPGFIFNLDETGLDDRQYGKKKVVSTENTPTCYRICRSAGHITVIPTVFADGTVATPMIVISRKSIDNELLKYGFPNGNAGYVVSSQKGYITKELFESYFEDIIVPHIERKRKEKNKLDAKAVAIIDGCSAHTSEKLENLLSKNNIKLFYLPSHSSHLTQPLDLLIFSSFKRLMLKMKTTIQVSELSKRILLALKGIHMSTNFFDIINCFTLAGFIIDLEPGKEKLSFEITKVLSNDRSPDNEVKTEVNKRKKKRTKLKGAKPKFKKRKLETL